MNDYISKPIDPEVLFRTLLKWIKPTLKSALKEEKHHDYTACHPLHISDLPVIEGLNTQLGLQRVLGKKVLYFNMLKNYVNGQESLPAALFDALERSDIEQAQRLAHTAKSVSGNIGAMALYEMAGNIEMMIAQKESFSTIRERITAFDAKQKQLINELKDALPHAQPRAIEDNEDIDAAQLVLDALQKLLQDDDMEALHYFNEHSERLTVLMGEEAARGLAQRVKNIDFEKALALIDEHKAFLKS